MRSHRERPKSGGEPTPREPTRRQRVLAALRGFLHGFVGQTDLPRDCAAARHALDHQASRRGRCC